MTREDALTRLPYAEQEIGNLTPQLLPPWEAADSDYPETYRSRLGRLSRAHRVAAFALGTPERLDVSRALEAESAAVSSLVAYRRHLTGIERDVVEAIDRLGLGAPYVSDARGIAETAAMLAEAALEASRQLRAAEEAWRLADVEADPIATRLLSPLGHDALGRARKPAEEAA